MYKHNPAEIFNLRNGGLAIYGGIIAVFFAGIVFCRIRKISFAAFADVCVPCVAAGQAIGRWGNFFNREAFGDYTDSLLAMRYRASDVMRDIIPESVASRMVYEGGEAYIQVAPTFLYESLWNTGLFVALTVLQRHKKFDGQILFTYFAGYGIGRFWIERLRTDQLMLFGTGIPVSQAVAVIMTVVSVAMIVFFLLKRRDKTKIK
jgi:phosphatidylglycerol:prolipoprotein diacylglycerol transferase